MVQNVIRIGAGVGGRAERERDSHTCRFLV